MKRQYSDPVQAGVKLIDLVKSWSVDSEYCYIRLPNCYDHARHGDTLRVTLSGKPDNLRLRALDPWGLFFLDIRSYRRPIEKLRYVIKQRTDIEFLLRRVSFLAINNPTIQFSIEMAGRTRKLYTKQQLFKRSRNMSDLLEAEGEKKSRVNEASLELSNISRLLDYALVLGPRKSVKPEEQLLCCLVSKRFHPQFEESVLRHYETKGKGYGFSLKRSRFANPYPDHRTNLVIQ